MWQPSGQRLQTRMLSLSADALRERVAEDPSLASLLESSGAWLHRWPLPGHLLAALEEAQQAHWQPGPRRWLWEGLALQLLAHGLPSPAASGQHERLPPRERQRLETVRQALHDDPARQHSLASLARLAAMSPSNLRSKFHAAYGQSVFDYLRERRLTLAREDLQQGHSVQQTAQFVGYRHATNFATAFRRRYGIAPHSVK